jgi:hypothetical protein
MDGTNVESETDLVERPEFIVILALGGVLQDSCASTIWCLFVSVWAETAGQSGDAGAFRCFEDRSTRPT